ncbi:hypothetical protein MGYG_02972 [Nannizzia gypsea CBS 118893]|uniref:Uncharacterized protein n=1 Tax=Arthroderma gypseum (strain ATCC MYA-4604 / CBS 118893) TaxID=535722 RepID=E4UQ45_ARTGP|nr:hypothetical protein MGYG_02972 [Nannizzia gypsea CBS 118893]EFQ99964.1 hypothetical protein MGYG_02972 [Nannizzia gypsea CBS 118893]
MPTALINTEDLAPFRAALCSSLSSVLVELRFGTYIHLAPSAPWNQNQEPVSPGFKEYERDLMNGVAKADVIFCRTSSENPLFSAEYLLSTQSTPRKGRFIAAGSCRPNMAELDPRIPKDATEAARVYNNCPGPVLSRGAVVVDTLESCLLDAG